MKAIGAALGLLLAGGCEPPEGEMGPIEQPPTCGNVVLDPGEACDPSIASTVDCTPECTLGRCGDGFITGVETCDDGNTRPDDGCTAQCTAPWTTLWSHYELGDEAVRLIPTALAAMPDDAIVVAARRRDLVSGGYLIGSRLLMFDSAGALIASRDEEGLLVGALAASPAGSVVAVGPNSGRAELHRFGPGLEPLDQTSWEPSFTMTALALDEAGAALVCGGVTSSAASHSDFRVDKLAPDGALQWTQQHNAPGDPSESCYGVAVYEDIVYAVGYEEQTSEDADLVVRRYTTEGALGWTQRIAQWRETDLGAHAAAVDASGTLAVVGFHRPPPGAIANAFVAAFADNGATWWEKAWTSVPGEYASARAVEIDAGGNLVVVGHADAVGKKSSFVLVYDSVGSLRASHLRLEPRATALNVIDAKLDSTGAIVVLMELRAPENSGFVGIIKLAR